MAKLSVDQALLKAKSHARKGEIEEAQKLYRDVLQAFPKNKRAQQGLAVLNKPKQSTVTQGPPQDTINRLINLYNQGQLGAVVEQAKALTLQYPDAYLVWNILGAANKGLGRVEVASEAFKKVTKLNPTYADGFNNLGVTLQEQGKLDEAIQAYNKALSLKPDYAGAYNNMGNTLKDQGKLDEAIASYNKALSLKPDYAEAYYNMANALKDQGKLDEAIASYTKALSLKPDYADASYNMGNALQEQGKLDEAIQAYNNALSLKPDYAEAYRNMGATLEEKGKLDEAIEAYNKALSIKPDYAEAYKNIGNALKEKGKLDEAVDAFNKALSLQPDYAEASHLLSSLTGKTTKSAPTEYVENMFDRYASKFDQSLVVDLSYDIPAVVTQLAIKKHGSCSLGSILDLGCGTGLIGEQIRTHCTYLEGIDLSRKMLELAKSKNVYDKLGHSDIVGYLSNAELNFDYFIATDVFIYVGELSDVFRLIKARNKKPGKLIFSTEHTKEEGFHLEKSGRYSHSKSYIEGLCREFKFTISHFSETNLRKEKGDFLIGGLYFLNF